MESPNVTNAADESAVETSTSASQYQAMGTETFCISALFEKLPGPETYVSCCAQKWVVVAGVRRGRKMLIASSVNGDIFKATGSLNMGAPGGILTDSDPPNVKRRSVAGMIVEPCSTTATWASPISRAEVPYAFENR